MISRADQPARQAIVTIVSNNYLHFARTLMESVARHHPGAARYCVIVDTDMAPAAAVAGEFEAISLDRIGLPFGDEFTFQYTILELNTAVKPWALEHLLDRGHQQVLYIDPDIYLYRELSEVNALLDGGASIVLTPHMLAPATDDKHPDERTIRMAGTYNLGFCAISEHPATRRMLGWWQGKLARDCVVDLANGIFVDQSWMDMAPGLFDQVAVLRHPGYNVAYWNMAQRHVEASANGYLVNGEALAFFHYSGVNPQEPEPVSKHQDRFRLDNVEPAVRALLLAYCERVIALGQAAYRKLPYGYANFTDGTPIPSAVRARFRASPMLRSLASGKPFDAPHLARSSLLKGAGRLSGLYRYFLRRPADPAALRMTADRCGSLYGYLRTAAGIARSAEARMHPGWTLRVLGWPVHALSGQSAQAELPAAVTPGGTAPARLAIAPGASPASEPVPGINLIGYVAAELGLGEAARSLARACVAAQVPYSVFDVGFQSSNLQRDRSAFEHASNRHFPIDLVYVNADQAAVTVNHLRASGAMGAYRIGFWHWEQPRFPERWLDAFTHLDEIWVPSTFVRDAIAAVSPLPVFVVPHALEFSASPGARRSDFGLPEDKVLALVMYDFHSYQHRKNPQAAIAAFRQAAAGRSDAVLVLKTINGEHHPEALATLRASLADLPGTVVIDTFLTRQQVWDLQSCCDMLVSLHRAEGFGLGPAEMMYLGKPVVATNWSANTDFMDDENSMPVHYTLKPLEQDVGAYPAGPDWAEADIGHAAQCIRRLLEDPALRHAIGARAALDIRAQLAPAVVGNKVRERLQAISMWHPRLKAGQ